MSIVAKSTRVYTFGIEIAFPFGLTFYFDNSKSKYTYFAILYPSKHQFENQLYQLILYSMLLFKCHHFKTSNRLSWLHSFYWVYSFPNRTIYYFLSFSGFILIKTLFLFQLPPKHHFLLIIAIQLLTFSFDVFSTHVFLFLWIALFYL